MTDRVVPMLGSRNRRLYSYCFFKQRAESEQEVAIEPTDPAQSTIPLARFFLPNTIMIW